MKYFEFCSQDTFHSIFQHIVLQDHSLNKENIPYTYKYMVLGVR